MLLFVDRKLTHGNSGGENNTIVPVRQKTIKKSNNLFLYPVRSPLPHSDIIYGDSLGLSRIL